MALGRRHVGTTKLSLGAPLPSGEVLGLLLSAAVLLHGPVC